MTESETVEGSDQASNHLHHHRDVAGGGIRAAVFGLSDGLVTNVSLILGVAGAHPGGPFVTAGRGGRAGGRGVLDGGGGVRVDAGPERAHAARARGGAHRPAALAEGRTRRARGDLRASWDRPARSPSSWWTRSWPTPSWRSRPMLARSSDSTPVPSRRPSRPRSPPSSRSRSGAMLPLIPWLVGSGTGATLASVVIGAVTSILVGFAARRDDRPFPLEDGPPSAAGRRGRRRGDLRDRQGRSASAPAARKAVRGSGRARAGSSGRRGRS